ncbi:MAG: DNA-binding protein [Alphaproteobacteria bacterium]|nr:DNA-binding protein [Alphaproteobacteria bacterium]
MVHDLARLIPDRAITAFLNRAGKRTGKGHSWTEARVRAFRSRRGIPVYREGERQERNELTQTEAAERLNISARTMNRLIRNGIVAARQICKGAPWVIVADALELPRVAAALAAGASASNATQETFDFE